MNLDFLNIQAPQQPKSNDFARNAEPSVKEREEFETKKSNAKPGTALEEKNFFKVLQSIKEPQPEILAFQTPAQNETINVSFQTKTVNPLQDTVTILNTSVLPKSAETTSNLVFTETTPDEIESDFDLSFFFTPQELRIETNSLPSKTTVTSTTDASLSNILNLNNDIKALLQTIKESAPKIEQAPTLTASKTEATPEETIVNLYGIILNAIEPKASPEQKTPDPKADILKTISLLLDNKSPETNLLVNLTPQDTAQIQKTIDKILEDDVVSSDELIQLDDLLSQIVVLTPPTPKKNQDIAQIQPRAETILNAPVKKSQDTNTSPITEKITDTKPETLTTQQPAAPHKHFSQTRYDARYDIGSRDNLSKPATSESDFKNALKEADTQIITQKLQNILPVSQKFALGTGETPTLLSSQTITTQSPSMAQTPSQLVQSNLTSQVTQSSQAAYPHPATQAVVATIQRAVKGGEDTNIKLQLDPPELGRIEVKMSIGKDAKTKIVLTAEKPETYFLLQRDAQILERALQNSGLETGQGSLTFEMARDNQNFGNNNQRGGGHDTGGKGSSNTTQNDIETTMSWHIDPRTGSMRYNVLV